MPQITMKDMLDAGVHFGHQTQRWNPKMKPYIFTVRNNIHILDLEKTKNKLAEALSFASDTAAKGGGWVEYEWPHPQTKKIESKISYAKKLTNYEGFVGVGAYR